LENSSSSFTAEIFQSARTYEEVAAVAEAKINSWDSFFEQKQTEFTEVRQQIGSVEIQSDNKIFSP